MRTSQSDPLQIHQMSVGPGRIGITFLPGKKGPSVFGSRWDRELETDIAAIRQWDAGAVLTLVEDHELQMLEVDGLGRAVADAGMDWYHLPIPDLAAPGEREMQAWKSLSTGLHQLLDTGGSVVVHCRGGRGRAGTIAALLLIERGEPVDSAIALVRGVREGAIETQAQLEFLHDVAALSDRGEELAMASLFAGAMGDALGAEIEFLSLGEIRRRFPDGVDEILPHAGRVGNFTDDTQMSLFTAEGLVSARLRGSLRGICHPPSVVHHALLRWLVTQGEGPAIETDQEGLVADPRMHHRRAPGMTCLSSLRAAPAFGTPALNDSKGCGSIMRVAPVGLLPGVSNRERWQLAIDTSALTHGHHTAQESAAAWAMILAAVADGREVEQAARNIPVEPGGETAAAINAALVAPRDGSPETVEKLGAGWVAEEALSIALYAAVTARDLEEGLRIAVTHSGDSDSTGAIAGNLLGLRFPSQVMRHAWRREIECADLIARISRDLMRQEFSHGLTELYPAW